MQAIYESDAGHHGRRSPSVVGPVPVKGDTAALQVLQSTSNATLTSLLISPQAQASITNYGSAKLIKGQLAALHESLAMHSFSTGTSFQQIKDPNVLKAFQIANPSVTLPTRQKLAGPLLDK